MSLDKHPLLNENNQILKLTQDNFIDKFNELNRIMISAPDLYDAGKNQPEVIESLQKDFNESWIVTSTRIQYEEDSLEGTITHYFGSNVISPNEKRLIIPYYNGTNLNDVLGDEQGLIYLQVLFNTSDAPDELKKTLKNLSNKESSKTKIWTPDQSSRKQYPVRAAWFNVNFDVFHVGGGDHVDSGDGRSRGVFDNPAGAAQKYKVKETNKELNLPFNLNSGIDRKSSCVYFSNTQNISSFVKYSSMFCFNKNRFVVSLITSKINNDFDKKISALLSKGISSKEALTKFGEEFSPIYAHLLKYEQKANKFVLADDLEAFGEPRIKVGK